MEDPVVPLERNLYGHPLAGLLLERQFRENPIETWVGENSKLGMVSLHIVANGLFLSVYVDDIKLAGKKQKLDPHVETYSTKKSIWENQHLSWIMYTWDALKENAK